MKAKPPRCEGHCFTTILPPHGATDLHPIETSTAVSFSVPLNASLPRHMPPGHCIFPGYSYTMVFLIHEQSKVSSRMTSRSRILGIHIHPPSRFLLLQIQRSSRMAPLPSSPTTQHALLVAKRALVAFGALALGVEGAQFGANQAAVDTAKMIGDVRVFSFS
jgi:hypothetical protein